MKRRWRFVLAGLLLSLSLSTHAQSTPPPKTVSESIDLIWKEVAHDFVSLADAVPEAKWNYKPTQGDFKNVRTFAEQVKHVACANEGWAKQILGEEPPSRCDQGGPNPAKTKTEIMAYLRQSFALMDKAIAGTNTENFLQANNGPYWGPNRISALTAATWHVSDHYGQLVEYARMNGVVPPASR